MQRRMSKLKIVSGFSGERRRPCPYVGICQGATLTQRRAVQDRNEYFSWSMRRAVSRIVAASSAGVDIAA